MTDTTSKPATLGARLKILYSRKNLPRSRTARIGLGAALVIGGIVGFLPVLGFWMLPIGLAILSVDIPFVRHITRKVTVGVSRFFRERRSNAPPP